MISAGQMVPQQQYPQQYPQQYGSQYGASPYGSMAPQMGQAPQLPQWNSPMQQMPVSGGPNISLSSEDVDPAVMNKAIESQAANTRLATWGTIAGNTMTQLGGMLNNCLQGWLNGKYLDNQKEMITGHYALQGKIVEGQTTVALKQYDVQEKAISAQQSMHQVQASHEEKMAKITGNVQVKLAAMDQSGRTERAKILAVTDPFSNRGQYDSGLPAFPC